MQIKTKLLMVLSLLTLSDTLLSDSIYTTIPEKIDVKQRYLFFLHGNIIEKKGLPASSKKYGDYEYEDMLEEFSDADLTVVSEARQEDTDVFVYAVKIKSQVKKLLEAGVPPSNITVAGFSKGGRMTLYVSSLLKNNKIKFVILAGCPMAYLGDEDIKLFGQILSIYEQRDDMFDSCEKYFSVGDKNVKTKELVLDTGEGHGVF